MGPHYANFRGITEDLRAQDAIRIVPMEELAGALINLLSDTAGASAIGERARHVFRQQAGATARSVDAIRGILEPKAETAAVGAVPRGDGRMA
jgi:3-deoxy-D-manno-octulosonic-acid transferase